MTKFWRVLISAGLAGLLWTGAAPLIGAESIQSLEAITTTATTFAAERARQQGYATVAANIKPLDPRLRLPSCSEPLTALPVSSGQVLGAVNVGVRCAGDKPWTIYVRVHTSAQQTVPVLARPLPRLAIVTKDDLKLIQQPMNSAPNGVIFDPNQIIGMELVRPLDIGSPVKVSQLRAPKVIKRGQKVSLVANSQGVEVRIDAKALEDAAAGERISVSNLSSGKRVEGIAHADGTVWVQ